MNFFKTLLDEEWEKEARTLIPEGFYLVKINECKQIDDNCIKFNLEVSDGLYRGNDIEMLIKNEGNIRQYKFRLARLFWAIKDDLLPKYPFPISDLHEFLDKEFVVRITSENTVDDIYKKSSQDEIIKAQLLEKLEELLNSTDAIFNRLFLEEEGE